VYKENKYKGVVMTDYINMKKVMFAFIGLFFLSLFVYFAVYTNGLLFILGLLLSLAALLGNNRDFLWSMLGGIFMALMIIVMILLFMGIEPVTLTTIAVIIAYFWLLLTIIDMLLFSINELRN